MTGMTYSFGKSKEIPFSSAKDLKSSYSKLRGDSFSQIQKLFPKPRELLMNNVSLHTCRDDSDNSLKIAVN